MQIAIPNSAFKALGLILLGVALGVGFAVGPQHIHFPDPKPAPKPAPAPAPDPKPDWFGWHPDGGHKVMAASMPKFRVAAQGLMGSRDAGDKRPILLYKAYTDLFRAYPPYPAQQIGDCVSFGHAHANDLLQCIEWILSHPRSKPPSPADIQETDTEFLYGAAREVGGMLGRQDGCYGSAAVKAMTEIGVLSRRQLGEDGAYSGHRAKQWGLTGPPKDLVEKAAKYKLGAAAQVTSWDELVAALHNGFPVTICTGQGFTLTRDSQGFCRARGSWGHCMFITGVRFDREGACVVQSWGPVQPTGPTALDQPSYSFWVDREIIERILAEGDSWALSKAPNFGQGEAAAARRRRLPESWRRAA